MIKWIMILYLVTSSGRSLTQVPVPPAVPVPILEIIKQGVIRVIKAVDLKMQRLQNETIWLQHAQKVMENTLSKLKLDEIASWMERQKALYENYFDELWRVREAITYYHRIRDIIAKQAALVRVYQQALTILRKDRHFSADESVHMKIVYDHMLDQSVQNVDQLFIVINAFITQMPDASRLAIIDDVDEQVDQQYADLIEFNQQNMMLSLQRAKDENDWKQVKALYGVE